MLPSIPSQAYIQIIRQPLLYLPVVAAAITDAAVALGRISTYLLAEELGEPFVVEEESTNAVDIRDGSFVWEAAGTLEGKKGGKDAKKGDGKKEKGAGKKETKGEDETKGLREKLFKKKAQTAGKGESEKDILPTHSSRTSTTVAPAPSPPPEEDKPFSLHSISLRIPKHL